MSVIRAKQRRCYYGSKHCDPADLLPLSELQTPHPSNKPLLLPLDNGRIALFHTPNPIYPEIAPDRNPVRFPYEMWISDDDMRTWSEKIRLTDFPGSYCYSDGFYENGHIKLVVEHNRHTTLFFDITL